MVYTLCSIFQLSLKGASVSRDRPDILWKAPASLLAYQSLTNSFPEQPKGVRLVKYTNCIAQCLVSPRLGWRVQLEISRVALVLGIASVLDGTDQPVQLIGVAVLAYPAFEIEPSTFTIWRGHENILGVRLPNYSHLPMDLST